MSGELTPGAPIVVASATFQDGKEEGGCYIPGVYARGKEDKEGSNSG